MPETTTIRSRILQYFSREVLTKLNKICNSNIITDNNLKVDAMLAVLREHDVDFIELGPGTNRLAILIDNYVFKIAMDKWGVQDNVNEFTVSQELQPYVVKTYETNDLISVCEYVTVISREEFMEKKYQLQQILSVISDSYLLGDVGTVEKNFCNWGYRDSGELVILDFAYIYRIKGDEILCSQDNSILDYDENFHSLICPKCRRKYTFMDVRRKIPMEDEKHENMIAKKLAYKITEPVQEFVDSYNEEEDKPITSGRPPSSLYTNNKYHASKEENKMYREDDERYVSKEESDEAYEETLELIRKMKNKQNPELVSVERTAINSGIVTKAELEQIEETSSDTVTNIIDIHRSKGDESTHIRIFKQEPVDEASGEEQSITETALDAAVTVEQAMKEVDEIENNLPNDDDVVDQILAEMEEDGIIFSETVTIAQDTGGNIVAAEVNASVIVIDDDETIVLENNPDFEGNDLVEVAFPDGTDLSEFDGDTLVKIKLEDKEQGVVLETDTQTQGGTVVIHNTVNVTENIQIENIVTVKDDNAADELRRQLLEDEEEKERKKIEELAKDYEHLGTGYENRGKGGPKQWV